MARVKEGSHSFTCHPHVYPRVELVILPLLPNRSASPHFGRYSFPVPLRVEGWVGLGGWLHTEEGVTHPSTNRARRRVTSLIRPTPLPLCQTAT